MEGILLLLLAFSLWQFIEHRKNRKQMDVNWAEVAQCEAELADAHPAKIIALPTMEERIDSCYQTLEERREEWLRSEAEFRAMYGEEDEASPSMEMVDLLYTANHMHRAVIFKAERQYFLSFENLRLYSEYSLHHIYEPGRPCGEWQYDGGERYLDDLESARAAACDVLKLLD